MTALVTLACVALAKEPRSPNAATVEFDGHTLLFAFKGTNPGEKYREYIPKEEKLESWTKYAAIRHYTNHKDPLDFAKAVAQMVKQHNPLSQSAVLHNKETGAAIIDFITWPPDGAFVEFNIFKFQKDGAGGLIAHQYAVREYGEHTEFMLGLKELRQRLINSKVTDGLVIKEPRVSRR
jgi:hypothetical protein